jgi:agmatinase
LPILRALHSTWGRVAVLHFDSHLDTWDPQQLGGGLGKYSDVNHGTMLHIAHEEGLLSNNSNMHLGSRCALFDEHFDLNNDLRCGFSMIRARDLDKLGIDKVVRKIVDRVGNEYVYLSIDIDVLDPAFAPATGTIEPGGWTTREVSFTSSNGNKMLRFVAAGYYQWSIERGSQNYRIRCGGVHSCLRQLG